MQTQEDRDLYRDMIKTRDERTILQCIAMLLVDIHDELRTVRVAVANPLVVVNQQKETPRPGRQPATTKG